MEQQNGTVVQLIEVLKREQEVLQQLYGLIGQQMECYGDDDYDDSTYDSLQQKKDTLLESLEQCDSCWSPLIGMPSEGEKQQLQHASRQVTIWTEKVQEREYELRNCLIEYLQAERHKIKERRIQDRTTNTYYKTMTKQLDRMSYFYDKKN